MQRIFVKGVDSVTKLNKDSAFYKTAQEIANDFELDWDNLSPEDNNELMIALLEEYYQKVNVDGNFSYTISIKVTKKILTKLLDDGYEFCSVHIAYKRPSEGKFIAGIAIGTAPAFQQSQAIECGLYQKSAYESGL